MRQNLNEAFLRYTGKEALRGECPLCRFSKSVGGFRICYNLIIIHPCPILSNPELLDQIFQEPDNFCLGVPILRRGEVLLLVPIQ